MNILKYIVLILFSYLPIEQYAQSVVLGAGGSYGADIKNVAPNLRAYVFTNERICIGPEITYFPKQHVGEYQKSLAEFNITGHYIFELTEELGFYPLTGINYSVETEYMHDESEVQSVFGLNIGSGFHYKSGRLMPYIEYNYVLSELGEHTFSAGILINLGKGEKEEAAHQQ